MIKRKSVVEKEKSLIQSSENNTIEKKQIKQKRYIYT